MSCSFPFPLTVVVISQTGFTAPDTICVNQPVNIINTTNGGTTFYWNFCSGNANSDPTGLNIGNPGSLLSIPTYITLVQQGNDCYSFISCQGVGVVRYYHGGSFKNNPISWTNLGTFGIIDFNEEGIQVKYDETNNTWYGFVNSDTTIIRLDFGSSLANTPTALNLNISYVFNFAHGLAIIKEGTTWLGFVTCSFGNKIYRLNFGPSLSNLSPVIEDLGNPGNAFFSPGTICIVKENSLWYQIIAAGNNSIARLFYGNSLLNMPTGQNLGNPGGMNTTNALTILRECGSTNGYYCNYLVDGQLGKLNFPTGVSGTVTGQLLGNIGNLNRPHSFSEIFRLNDTLYAYVTNRGNGTLTRLTFLPCNNATPSYSTLFNPPPFTYNQTGTYNIRLLVDEGLLTESSACKSIVVVNPATVNLGQDDTICPLETKILNAGAGFSSYLWSTGASTQAITVNTPGTYWVNAEKWGCTASDTVHITLVPAPSVNLGNDTIICSGSLVTFDAGACSGCSYQWSNLTTSQMNIGNSQTYTTGTAAEYMVTVVGPHSCIGRDTVQLSVEPSVPVSVIITASSNPFCVGIPVTFITYATNEGISPSYQWKVNGINVGPDNPIYSFVPNDGDVVSCVLNSSIPCPTGNPATSNSITLIENTNVPVSVSISPSANPVCSGTSVTFLASPANEGSSPVYQWKVNGTIVGTNNPSYSFIPVSGDIVTCVLNSSEICTTNNPATSNQIIMTVNPNLPVSITITASANPVCSGIAGNIYGGHHKWWPYAVLPMEGKRIAM